MQTAIFVSAVFLTFVVDPNQHVFKKKNGRARLPQHWTEIHFFWVLFKDSLQYDVHSSSIVLHNLF